MQFRPLAALVCLLAGCPAPDAAEPVAPWTPGEAVDTAELPVVRGMRDYRGIVHLHSYFSHDACDGHERPEFTDAQCLVHLREGICRTKQDYIYLTDHPAYFYDAEFPDVLLYDPKQGDALVDRGGKPAANWLMCPDGRQVLLQAGFEASNVMTGGLYGHAGTDPASRKRAYAAETTDEVKLLTNYGGAVYIPHTESKDFAWYSQLPIDAQEIYNLHANVDPRIREKYLGLGSEFFGTMLKFTSDAPRAPHPDLSFLSFYAPNGPALDKWDRVLALKKVAGIAGTDAHENVFTSKMRDGERGDSYRRLMSFFSNHVRTAEPMELDVPKRAIKALRSYIAFEALGVPDGFDFRAEAGGEVFEMGDDAPAGATLVLVLPRVYRLDPAAEPPELTGVIYRVDAEGRSEAARGSGAVVVKNAPPGVYRAQVQMVPRHLRAHLGDLADQLIIEYTWIYGNPVFVK